MKFSLTYEEVRDALYEAEVGFDESIEEVMRTDYSGRGMYGDNCFGIVTSEGFGAIYKFLRQLERDENLTEMDEYAVERLADNMRTDSMGYSTIYYFPMLQITDVDASELWEALKEAGHDVDEMEGDDFAVRSYAEAIGFAR